MNKKAFTIVELLLVVGILAAIMLIAAPGIMKSGDAAREKSYYTKMSMIEKASILYGQDNRIDIMNKAKNATENYDLEYNDDGEVAFYTMNIKVRDLIPDYLAKDKETGVKMNEKIYYIQDPRSNSHFLDDDTIVIKVNAKTRKVAAYYQES